MDAFNDDLIGMVDGHMGLFQVLHHGYTIKRRICNLVIGDRRKLMAVLKIRFSTELLDVYHEVLNYAFGNSPAMNLAHANVEGNNDSILPQEDARLWGLIEGL